MFKKGQKVKIEIKLIIGKSSFDAVVHEVYKNQVYLVGSKLCFQNSTGYLWGSVSGSQKIV